MDSASNIICQPHKCDHMYKTVREDDKLRGTKGHSFTKKSPVFIKGFNENATCSNTIACILLLQAALKIIIISTNLSSYHNKTQRSAG